VENFRANVLKVIPSKKKSQQIFIQTLPVGCLYQENLKFEIKKGGPHIRLGAGGPLINSLIPEIICFEKGLYLDHSPYALTEQKNREKVKREIQQWMRYINVKAQFYVRFIIKALVFSRQGYNMFQARSVLAPHTMFYEC